MSFLFWCKKSRIGFEFKRNKSATFRSPEKALCPAKVSLVSKYSPIIFPGDKSKKQKSIMITPNRFADIPLEKVNILRAYLLKNTNLYHDFEEIANLNLTTNLSQIVELLESDLTNHIKNMRVVYEVYGIPVRLNGYIRKLENDRSKFLMDGGSLESQLISSMKEKIKKLEDDIERHEQYVTQIRKQHVIGEQIVYSMLRRVESSLDDVEDIKKFYLKLGAMLNFRASDTVKFDDIKDKKYLMESALSEDIIAAMSRFGVKIESDGTLTEDILSLEGGDSV